jgi:hypothetical protein
MKHIGRDLHLRGRGIRLVPSFFCWRHPIMPADSKLPAGPSASAARSWCDGVVEAVTDLRRYGGIADGEASGPAWQPDLLGELTELLMEPALRCRRDRDQPGVEASRRRRTSHNGSGSRPIVVRTRSAQPKWIRKPIAIPPPRKRTPPA